MKSRLIALGVAATTLALALSGCGSDSGSGSGSGTVASQLIFGGPAQFKTRADGLPGLKKNYGVEFGKVTTADVGGPVTVTKLKRGQIDVADIFTTDPSIKANGFVVLTDPKSNFAAQNVVPIINKAKATDGVKQTLNAVSGKLSTDDLGKLVDQAQNQKQDPAEVAKGWLSDSGLDAAGTAAKGQTITVGSAGFPENIVLAEIYAQALQAQGATIKTKLNIGERAKYFPALKAGSIDLFPEYNGSALYYVDTKATATSQADVDKALASALPSNLIALDSADAQDSDAIVVTKQTAQKYGLTSIADLAKSAK